jgi:uncharacterized membrane protein
MQLTANTSDASYTDIAVPNAFWRAFAAFIYLVPLLDSFALGVKSVYGVLPQTQIVAHIAFMSPHNSMFMYKTRCKWFVQACLLPACTYTNAVWYAWPCPAGPTRLLTSACLAAGMFRRYYYIHQFMPLVVFFFIFLAIIKNQRLHHFVRFNAMQAMMLDIMVMLPAVANSYIPGEIYWTVIGDLIVATQFLTMFACLSWAICATMCGRYADLPIVSDAVYMQVYQIGMID